MDRSAGNVPPCAVCKHQRKRCEETCGWVAFFPGNRFQEFQNAHKLFGVSNILKLMSSVEPSQSRDTSESLVMEANARAEDPVRGCLGIVQNLTAQIAYHLKELRSVNQQLDFFRGQEKDKQPHSLDPSSTSSPSRLLSSDLNGQPAANEKGYNYQSTLEEYSDVESVSMQSMNRLMECSHQVELALADVHESTQSRKTVWKEDTTSNGTSSGCSMVCNFFNGQCGRRTPPVSVLQVAARWPKGKRPSKCADSEESVPSEKE